MEPASAVPGPASISTTAADTAAADDHPPPWRYTMSGQAEDSARPWRRGRRDDSWRKAATAAGTALFERVQGGGISVDDFISEAMGVYPELSFYVGGVQATADRADDEEGSGPAPAPAAVIEQQRTLTCARVIYWVFYGAEGDYEGFTGGQPEAVRLTRASFGALRSYLIERAGVRTPADMDLLLAVMAFHDVGKIDAWAADVSGVLASVADGGGSDGMAGQPTVAHDKVLAHALAALDLFDFDPVRVASPWVWPVDPRQGVGRSWLTLGVDCMQVPSFTRLPAERQRLWTAAFRTEYNIGQLCQGENVAASLAPLTALLQSEPCALHPYLAHTLVDIAAAGGHVSTAYSVVMTEAVYTGFAAALCALAGLDGGRRSPAQVYRDFLGLTAERWGLTAARGGVGDGGGGGELSREDCVLVRLGLLMRITDGAGLDEARTEMAAMPADEAAQLADELYRGAICLGQLDDPVASEYVLF
jgi:hypothetical protein